MIVIDHAEFLSMRFDLVIRYYLLENHKFNAKGAGNSVSLYGRYEHLRSVFGQLLKMDVVEKEIIRMKMKKKRKMPEKKYGDYVALKLFLMRNWSWIEGRMAKDDGWIRENPYLVMRSGLGTSVKRLLLALKYGRTLYWQYGGSKTRRRSWEESEYEKLLGLNEYSEIRDAKSRMMDRMGELGFFSVDTYVGDRSLLLCSAD